MTGTSKGRGFQGGVKRHGFRGGPKTHGQSDRLRAPGSIGASATPGRVLKGMKMAGHMGDERVTMQNLTVIRVDIGAQSAARSGIGSRPEQGHRHRPPCCEEQGEIVAAGREAPGS